MMGGSFAQAFGVCANEFSPSDGRAVSLDHGCGGHSEIAVTAALPTAAAPIIDEVGYDVLTVHTTDQNDSSVEASSPAEPFGHS